MSRSPFRSPFFWLALFVELFLAVAWFDSRRFETAWIVKWDAQMVIISNSKSRLSVVFSHLGVASRGFGQIPARRKQESIIDLDQPASERTPAIPVFTAPSWESERSGYAFYGTPTERHNVRLLLPHWLLMLFWATGCGAVWGVLKWRRRRLEKRLPTLDSGGPRE